MKWLFGETYREPVEVAPGIEYVPSGAPASSSELYAGITICRVRSPFGKDRDVRLLELRGMHVLVETVDDAAAGAKNIFLTNIAMVAGKDVEKFKGWVDFKRAEARLPAGHRQA